MSAKPAPASTEAPKSGGGKSKILLIALTAVLVIGGGAGGAWYYLGAAKHDADDTHAQVPARAAPTYMPLESMVVNLADPGGERVAQVGITLDVDGDKTVNLIKGMMPAIRSRVLMLVSQRSSQELLKRDGKEKLADDIAAEVAHSLGHEDGEVPRKPALKKMAAAGDEEADEQPVRRKRRATPSPVNGVLFSSFIVQ